MAPGRPRGRLSPQLHRLARSYPFGTELPTDWESKRSDDLLVMGIYGLVPALLNRSNRVVRQSLNLISPTVSHTIVQDRRHRCLIASVAWSRVSRWNGLRGAPLVAVIHWGSVGSLVLISLAIMGSPGSGERKLGSERSQSDWAGLGG